MSLVLRGAAVLALASGLLHAQKSTSYRLSFPNADHHEVAVHVTFAGVPDGPLAIRMSRSSPGRYALHEFVKNVYAVHAADEHGAPLAVERPDPYGWNVSGHHGAIVFEYTLFGDRVDGTYAAIDPTHAHLNLPATLVWARGFESARSTLRFDIPPGSNWRVATELAPGSDGTWSAPNLEQLMDGPVELSAHAEPEWKIGDAVFRLALHGGGNEAQAAVFAQMCRRVVLEEAGIFGALPKYDTGSYTFLLDDLPWASYDGMEHRDSTVISGPRDLKDGWKSEIGAVSHEFFHSWNVRRIRPRSLEPFDFERADMSGELWFAEGFTNYYGMLTLARAGFTPLDSFAHQMGTAVNEVLTAPGREVHSPVDMSRLAPFVDAATSIDPTSWRNTLISYYTYGQALALGIDFAIRQHYPGKTLDDWMRVMWREHPDIDKPYDLKDLERTLGEAIGDEQFAHDIFEHHIYGMDPMPFEELLSGAGLALQKRHPGVVWLGSDKFDFTADGVTLTGATLRGSPLYAAGLDTGDRILQWDGKTLKSAADLDALLKRHRPGDHMPLTIERRGAQQATVELAFTEDPSLELVTYEKAGRQVTPRMLALRKTWLASRSAEPLGPLPAMP